jgi:putative ABC transport system permease protein
MVSIARKNLFHDKGRFAITLTGLVASLTLILFGMGMFIGTIDESVVIMDHTSADIWVVQEGNKDILTLSTIRDKRDNRVKAIQGVKSTHRLIYSPANVKRAKTLSPVMIVGLDLRTGVGAPWKLVSGDLDLRRSDTIVVDQSLERNLGKISVGDSISVTSKTDISQRVIGISQGAKWFINPYIFTSHENAQKLAGLGTEDTNFLLVELEPGLDPAQVARDISAIDGVDAFDTSAIRANTRNYMIFESGMGLGIGTMVVAGFCVAAIIIALTIYTATVERVPEFGTLKAIGASKRDIYKILIEQVLVSVTIGYALGVLCFFAVATLVTRLMLMPVKITPTALALAYGVTLALSLVGSFSSIRRVNRVDPAIVFRA